MASVATMRSLAPAPPTIASSMADAKEMVKPIPSTKAERPLRPLIPAPRAIASTSKLAIAQSRPLLPAAGSGPANGGHVELVSQGGSIKQTRPILSTKLSSTSQISVSSGSTASPSPQPSASNSESTVQPKKEWVLPARAKPGRKPSDVEPPTKRKAQNRASQRAFRERRQSYLASLEAKVAVYEERGASASQDIQRAARRLKEENDSLKTLNAQLVTRIQQLEEALKRQLEDHADRARPTVSVAVEEEPALASALIDTGINRDCGFCTEQSFCVCSGEASLDFHTEAEMPSTKRAKDTCGDKESVSVRPLESKKLSMAYKPKLWQTQSSQAIAKMDALPSRPRPLSRLDHSNALHGHQGADGAPFVAVGVSVRLRGRNASHLPKRRLWSVSSSLQMPSTSPAPGSHSDAFICPTASHWQRRWAEPFLSHRYRSQHANQSSLASRTLASPFDQTTHIAAGVTPRPLLLSPPSLSGYSLSTSSPFHPQQQHRTSRMTSSSRDEQSYALLPPRKASIWPLEMLADVVTRSSDDEKSSKASSTSEEDITSAKRKFTQSNSPTSKRRCLRSPEQEDTAILSRNSAITSGSPERQACACPLSKIM